MDSSPKISCTLFQAGQHNLVLPNSSIAEVLVTTDLTTTVDLPRWYAGEIKWDQRKIQVVSLDHLPSPLKNSERPEYIILIIRNPTPNSPPTYFGIIASAIPQIVLANSSTIRKNLQPTNLHEYSMSYVLLNGRPAMIPDIERIANLIKESQLSE